MVFTTDIIDWCFVEALGCEEGRRRCRWDPQPEDVRAMYEVSPIRHIDAYDRPTVRPSLTHSPTHPLTHSPTHPLARSPAVQLFLIGERDLRVPMSNPLQFISALSARGVTTRTLRFPKDCHPLNRPRTEFTSAVEAIEWIRRHAAAD